MLGLTLKLLESEYCVCQINSAEELQTNGYPEGFYTITQTEDETSLVCKSSYKIKTVRRENGWRMFKIDQKLEFEQVGIIAKISSILSDVQISLFVISTYNTDYLMVKDEKLNLAKNRLKKAGYLIT